MSNISTVYNAIVAKLGEIYPNKARIFNPYELKDNVSLLLKDAWGLKVNEATREDLDFCKLAISRSFTLVLSKGLATTSNNESAFDPVSTAILEDQQLFLNAFWSPSELGIDGIINRIEFSNIGGVDFIVSDEKKFLFSEIEFTILTSESVN
jgi:hypothetical protein